VSNLGVILNTLISITCCNKFNLGLNDFFNKKPETKEKAVKSKSKQKVMNSERPL
jgi:hypothetical protein